MTVCIRTSVLACTAVAALAYGATLAAAQAAAPGEDGRELFRTYCASCHGEAGRGDGPVSAVLRQRPPDLTQFAMRNSGVFPAEKLARIIDGRDVVAHGNPEMPVWGDAFKSSREHLDDAALKARIGAIVRFLEVIQMRRAE
jgi:mono/diheme cytochrome c family protein